MKYYLLLLITLIFISGCEDNPVDTVKPEILVYSLDSLTLSVTDSNTVSPQYPVRLDYPAENTSARFRIEFEMLTSDTSYTTCHISAGTGASEYFNNFLHNSTANTFVPYNYSFTSMGNASAAVHTWIDINFNLSLDNFQSGDFMKIKNLKIYRRNLN